MLCNVMDIKYEDGSFIVTNTFADSNGEKEAVSVNSYYGLVEYDSLKNLEGKILTIIDASISDIKQREAIKSILRRTFWFDWVEHHIYRGNSALPVGMPLTEISITNSII